MRETDILSREGFIGALKIWNGSCSPTGMQRLAVIEAHDNALRDQLATALKALKEQEDECNKMEAERDEIASFAQNYEHATKLERAEHETTVESLKRERDGARRTADSYRAVSKGQMETLESLRAQLVEHPDTKRLETASVFEIGDEITVCRCRQRDGSYLWAVRRFGSCLAKDGEWEGEPIPSSRDEDFISRCRFESYETAIEAAMAQAQEKPK